MRNIKFISKGSGKEKAIIWPGKPEYFCKTSGTTSGVKNIPYSKMQLKLILIQQGFYLKLHINNW